jgi:GT2 family glycosyltransferase
VIIIAIHVDLILVTYNSRRFLPDFLDSLKSSTNIPFHLFVIDNASTDQTRSYLTRIQFKDSAYHRMRLLFNTGNTGVAKAWNLGIGSCTGTYVVLVNPDIKFGRFWLEQMVECAENHPDSGVVGAKILGFNQVIDHAGFVNGVVLGRGEPNDPAKHNQIIAVDGIHGCCFLVRRQIFQTIGTFDERFFIYAEEDDFCIRVRQAGYQVLYCPATIYHYGSGSDIPISKRHQLHHESLIKFKEKWGMN